MNTETLAQIGLKELEIKIYLKLLERGIVLASGLAKELQLHRTSVYDILEKLKERGLVSYIIKSGKKYFNAVEPDKLLELEKERLNNLKEIVSELKKLKKEKKSEFFIEIYQGKEGIKTIWEDIIKTLKRGEEFLVLATGKAPKILPYYMPQFHTKRIKAKIKLKIIYGNTSEEKIRGNELKKMPFVQVKYIPKEYSSPAATLIYNNKVSIILWEKENLGVSLINSREVSITFRNYFKLLWKIGKK